MTNAAPYQKVFMEPAVNRFQVIDISIRILRSTSMLMAIALLVPKTVSPAIANIVMSAPGKSSLESAAATILLGENTKRETPTDDGGLPFSISVDGEPVASSVRTVNRQRQTDVDLEGVDIQVKFDGLGVKPLLNVSTVPPRHAYNPGDEIHFLASTNYAAWIERQELLIYGASRDRRNGPLLRIPVSPEGRATWNVPEDGPSEYVYVLRVYDREGRFDETRPLTLARTTRDLKDHTPAKTAIAPGYGEDRTAVRSIQITGGAVTVFGRNVPEGHTVTVLGESVPVDAEGQFVVQRVLPSGEHDIDVAIKSTTNEGLTFNREIHIPENEWFYVALADITAGYRTGSNHIEDVRPGEYDSGYTQGRLAYYLKGKIKGKYLLTAAADTKGDELGNLFHGVDAKDARQFLRRLDPDDYYPIYGDDSTLVEDAPTRGKFYVRLERGDSHVMWGNFKADITGSEFLRNQRALYGASAAYRPDEVTASGERQTSMSVYAAQPGTLPQRDELRGTGGSAYFLTYQDITTGSETLTVEIRDSVTGRVLERRTLQYGSDYEIDYVQGVVLLKEPLSSTTSDGEVVRDGALGGNLVYLVANYEFTPATDDVDGYAYGGRAQQWLGNNVRVGVTGMSEETGSADQQNIGADIHLRYTDKTFIEAEVAGARGPGFGNSLSADGGVTISDIDSTGTDGDLIPAYRVRAQADLGELTAGEFQGRLEGYYEHFGEGFSTLDRQIDDAEQDWGVRASIDASKRVTVVAGFDEHREDNGYLNREAFIQSTIRLDDHWTIEPGTKHSERSGSSKEGDNGSRTDAGGRVAYRWNEDRMVYVLGQATLGVTGGRDRNDRIGIGGSTRLTEKISLLGEISEGTSGLGGLATLDYQPTADDHYYLGYRLDPDRNDYADFPSRDAVGDDLGSIVAGTKRRFSEYTTAYGENRIGIFGEQQTVTQAYGVTYTPDAHWTLGGGIESGMVFDATESSTAYSLERTAVSGSVGYRIDDNAAGRLKGEFRQDSPDDGGENVTTYLVSAGVSMMMSDDWRFITNGDAVFADSSETTRAGEYVEVSAGFAYRAADNDRLNALVKYTFLYDLPGADQVTINGIDDGTQQISHIFSGDVSYDLIPMLTLGAKYGFRISSVRDDDGAGEWEDANAHLGILRADFHLVQNWDALLEARVLLTDGGANFEGGLLAAIYRHFGDSLKIGLGYNFSRLSDDLRYHSLDSSGIFFNVVGKI